MIEVDGSERSGSGTIVRLAVSLCTILGRDLHLTNIRARSDKRGLRPQHRQVVAACWMWAPIPAWNAGFCIV